MIPSDDNPQGYRFFEKGFPDSHEGAVFKTSFRVWLREAVVGRRRDLGDAAKFNLLVRLCYKTIPAGTAPETLLKGIEWFSHCGESDRLDLLNMPKRLSEDVERVAVDRLNKPRAFDYFWDFKEIWASFRGTYGIDLYEGDLHWWAFSSLLAGLDGESLLARHVRIRTAEIKAGMKAEDYIPTKLAALPEDY